MVCCKCTMLLRGCIFPFKVWVQRPAASNKVPQAILFIPPVTAKAFFFFFFCFQANNSLKAVQSIIFACKYQDSARCNEVIAARGDAGAWIRLSVQKGVEVFGLASDSEHSHLPLQNIALCSSVSVRCVRAGIRMAGSPLNANTECGASEGYLVMH